MGLDADEAFKMATGRQGWGAGARAIAAEVVAEVESELAAEALLAKQQAEAVAAELAAAIAQWQSLWAAEGNTFRYMGNDEDGVAVERIEWSDAGIAALRAAGLGRAKPYARKGVVIRNAGGL